MQTPKRITGASVRTSLGGRTVDVVFRSPYRWRIYDGDRDVTSEFGHAKRGPSLPPHTVEWEAFHAEVAGNETRCTLRMVG